MCASEEQAAIHAPPRAVLAAPAANPRISRAPGADSTLAARDAQTTMAHTRTMRDATPALRCCVVANIAGGSCLALRSYVDGAHGVGAFAKLLDGLAPADSDPLRGILLPVSWYPVRSFAAALHASARLSGDPAFYERYGGYAAEFEIAAFQRVLLRFSTPAFFMDRAGRLWSRFHDSGAWEVHGSGNRLRGTLRDFALVDPRYCRVLGAWIKRAGEMTGSRGDVAHPECRSRGGAAEVFDGWWE